MHSIKDQSTYGFSVLNYLLSFILLVSCVPAFGNEVVTDYIRLRPGTVPSSCTNGQLRIKSSDGNLQICKSGTFTAIFSSGVAACSDLSDATTSCSTANASTNTASTIVKRDGSGDFSAGTITATLSGTATNATNVATTSTSTNATYYPLFVASSSNGNQAASLGTGLTFNPSTNLLTTTTFAGILSASGNIKLNSNYLSNDGGNEGLSVDNNGNLTATGAAGAPSFSAATSSTQWSINGGRMISGTNTTGGTISLNAGLGTGNGPSEVSIWTPLWKGSGSTAQDTLHRALTVISTSSTASQVQVQDTMTVGAQSGVTGTIGLIGTTSGTITIQPQAAAGTYNWNLPTTAGSANQVLRSGGGGSTAMNWSTSTYPDTASAGTVLTAASANTITASATPSLGVAATTSGTLGLADGGASGKVVTLQATGVTAANYNFNLPASAGSSGQVLTSAGGGSSAMTWSTPGATTGGWSYTTQTLPYTTAIGEWVMITGSTGTITLPTAVSQSGKSIRLQHNGTSLTQVYTINTTSSQTINAPDGSTIASGAYALYTNSEMLEVTSDGANWVQTVHNTQTTETDSGALWISKSSAESYTIPSSSIAAGTVYTSANGCVHVVSTTTASSTNLLTYSTCAPDAATATLTYQCCGTSGNKTYTAVSGAGALVKPTNVTYDRFVWYRTGAYINFRWEASFTNNATAGTGDDGIFLPAHLPVDTTNLSLQSAVLGAGYPTAWSDIGYGHTFFSGVNNTTQYYPAFDVTYSDQTMIKGLVNGTGTQSTGAATLSTTPRWSIVGRYRVKNWRP